LRLSLIVAMDRNGVIGAGGRLPWRIPPDLRRFKQITMGKPIVMGRRTHESIGRVLPGRENIVLTRDVRFAAAGCTVLHGREELLAHCAAAPEIFIMGGAEVYRQFMDSADRIYLTQVHADFAGDTYFPELDRSQWREAEREDFAADDANPYPHSFVILERN